ncbi:MAG: pirin family protein [Alphaproteobacteria bacterium]
MTEKLRETVRVIRASATTDGAGVSLNRSIGGPDLPELDPFLLLDEFNTDEGADYIAGFPDHPHRGFETVTYMIEGRMRHEDSTGAGGTLRSGGVQWMTAGRGIIHSEMPEQEDGLMQGFQLWVNLPARDKMGAPRYQNIEPEDIPETTIEGGATIRLVAGESADISGPVTGISVNPIFMEIGMPANTSVTRPVPAGYNGFCYVFEGEAEIGGGNVPAAHLAVLGPGDAVNLRSGELAARLLLVAGRPIGEPIARYGPFVMNTREEIQQAFDDYQSGNFGI